MQRSDYAFHGLTEADYETAVTHGTMPGYTSPMHGAANYNALMSTMYQANIDPRLPLAFAWAEGHMMSDPGLVAARVNNPGGVKYVGAPGTTDSGIPADTGGTYAAYADLGAYYADWVRIMNNSIIGPDFQSGNLIGAVEHYTDGPGTGHNKIDKFLEYQTAYPPQGGNVPAPTPTPDTGVYGEDGIARFETQIGHATSGTYDLLNGDHVWAYFCEAGVESTYRGLGLNITPRASAVAKLEAARAQGLLQQGEPEHGAQVFFDQRFYANDGHTGLWNAVRGQLLSTLTDGTGVGYKDWGPHTYGFAGWMRVPGVLGPFKATPVANRVIPDGNPFNAGIVDANKLIGFGGGFLKKFQSIPDALTITGFPIHNEQQAYVRDGTVLKQRTVQFCERCVLVYQPENPSPYDVVLMLRTSEVIPL